MIVLRGIVANTSFVIAAYFDVVTETNEPQQKKLFDLSI
jgi:hypothetical protein